MVLLVHGGGRGLSPGWRSAASTWSPRTGCAALRAAVDSLLRLLPSAVELPGCPGPPRPDFPPHLEELLDTVTVFAAG
jgi:hypothetical protein